MSTNNQYLSNLRLRVETLLNEAIADPNEHGRTLVDFVLSETRSELAPRPGLRYPGSQRDAS